MYHELFDEYGKSEYQKNITLDWIPMDTEELFITNLEKNKKLNEYKLNPIKYKLNNFGFRTPNDFNEYDTGNVFLGCSHTMGIGHHLENTWSYKLSQEIGEKFWNISIGGSGVMTHYRLLLYYIKMLKFKNVFHFIPYYGRYEFFIKDVPVMFPILKTNWSEYFGKFYDDGLMNYLQINIFNSAFVDAIKGLCYDNGINYIPIYSTKYDDYQGEIRNKKLTKNPARDLVHYDVEVQEMIFLDFLHRYENDKIKKHII